MGILANYKKQLNLTSEQEAKIRVMNLEHIQQQDEITNRIRSAQEEKRQNNEKFKNDVSSVLTPEQQAKAKEVMEERKEKAAERKAQRRK